VFVTIVFFPYLARCHYYKTCYSAWLTVDRTKYQIPFRKSLLISTR